MSVHPCNNLTSDIFRAVWLNVQLYFNVNSLMKCMRSLMKLTHNIVLIL